MPVTTVPGFRVPFHFSYLLFLAGRSESAALSYFRGALWLCRQRRIAPSLLLHPLDFLELKDAPDLHFFPGMGMPYERKRELIERFLAELIKHYQIIPLLDYVERLPHRFSARELSPSSA